MILTTVQAWLEAVLNEALLYVYQNFLLEERKEVVAETHIVWSKLLRACSPAVLHNAAKNNLRGWMILAATPFGVDYDRTLLRVPQRNLPEKQVNTFIRGPERC